VRVSFIIPLYNCLPLTQAMLASLRATLPAGLTHEIIFIDDGSTDGTREWLKALSLSNGLKTFTAPPFQVLLNERNLGYAISNNRAAAVARGEFLVLLNSDLVLTPGWLEPMFAAHQSLGPRAGLIGNVQLQATTGAVDHTGIIINRTGKPEHDRSRPSRLRTRLRPVREVPAVTGACLLVERALWTQLGGFDEAYINGGEDIDLGFRARAIGRVNAVALPSVIRHHVSSSPGRKLRDEQNSERLVRRWDREFVAAGEHATRDWCREYLHGALETPLSHEYRLAIHACLHAAHLRRTPPLEAVLSLEEGQAREFARWKEILRQ
jgi:GT2 family glycosyltransferase